MVNKRNTLGTWLVVLLMLPLWACDDSSPTAPSAPPPVGTGVGSFQIVGTGASQQYNFTSGMVSVLCSRNAGFASLFIRLQEGGNTGRRLDIDLCNHAGGGTFTPMDSTAATCGNNKTWDIFWHVPDGTVFVNNAMAPNCTLRMSQNGDRLDGAFDCPQLMEIGGGRSIDVVNGTFSCTET